MARRTAQERLDAFKIVAQQKKDALTAELRALEAAASEDARKAHRAHLWTLARACEDAGLDGYSAEELAPHLKALAAHLQQLSGVEDAPGLTLDADGSRQNEASMELVVH